MEQLELLPAPDMAGLGAQQSARGFRQRRIAAQSAAAAAGLKEEWWARGMRSSTLAPCSLAAVASATVAPGSCCTAGPSGQLATALRFSRYAQVVERQDPLWLQPSSDCAICRPAVQPERGTSLHCSAPSYAVCWLLKPEAMSKFCAPARFKVFAGSWSTCEAIRPPG